MNKHIIDIKLKIVSIGNSIPDSFFDSCKEEMCTCYDIINLIDNCDKPSLTVTFDKGFLKKIVRSHIFHIKELEKCV